jgi:hypothetical protein
VDGALPFALHLIVLEWLSYVDDVPILIMRVGFEKVLLLYRDAKALGYMDVPDVNFPTVSE